MVMAHRQGADNMRHARLLSRVCTVLLALCLVSSAVFAAPDVKLQVQSDNEDLKENLRAASLLVQSVEDPEVEARGLVSAALADYRRLVETLYAFGYYSGAVSVKLNGQEAASLSLLSLPSQINDISIAVDPGPPFRFGKADVSPQAPGTRLPEGFASGQPALATVIGAASRAAVVGWREAGYAKATQGDQRIVANHRGATLDAEVTIVPGPSVRFGDLIIKGESAVRMEALARIADLPTGEVFSPKEMSDLGTRLRRTGTFSSVSLREGDVKPDGTMDIEMTVVDRKPRRIGAGAELSSNEGLDLTAFWMHRNLFGAAERLRIEGSVEQIGAQDNGIDYKLGARLDFPAIFRSDTNYFIGARYENLDDPQFQSELFEVGGGLRWYVRDGLEAEIGIALHRSTATDAFGTRDFRFVAVPAIVEWDERDEPLNASRGHFIRFEGTPFIGVSDTASGARLFADARGYHRLGESRLVFAGRLQVGSILKAEIDETYPDYLFFSGGGGTVRGQPYQTLGVEISPGELVGGRSFLGTMLEMRADFTDALGGVLFADAGFVGEDSFGGEGDWHAGAGVGVRYNTGIGPLRFDIAAPVEGDTGDGVQFYIGIGQAF